MTHRGINLNICFPVIQSASKCRQCKQQMSENHAPHQSCAASEGSSENSFDVTEVSVAQVRGADDNVVALHPSITCDTMFSASCRAAVSWLIMRSEMMCSCVHRESGGKCVQLPEDLSYLSDGLWAPVLLLPDKHCYYYTGGLCRSIKLSQWKGGASAKTHRAVRRELMSHAALICCIVGAVYWRCTYNVFSRLLTYCLYIVYMARSRTEAVSGAGVELICQI